MKNATILLIAFSLFAVIYGCKKADDKQPAETYADKVTGNYLVADTAFVDPSCLGISDRIGTFGITISKVNENTVRLLPFHCTDTLTATVTATSIVVNNYASCANESISGTISGNNIYFSYVPVGFSCLTAARATAIKQP